MTDPATASPVIVTGMHRSGTSLVARVLEACGVNMGSGLDEYHEDPFYQDLNEELFRMAGATWDRPEPLEAALEDKEFFKGAVEYLEGEVAGKGQRERSRSGLPQGERGGWPWGWPWGWKDPRNTFTAGPWLRVFPEAAVVYVSRDPVDVAVSLHRRETSRPEGTAHPHYSERCQTLEGCHGLWQEYVARGDLLGRLTGRVYSLGFEELVRDPGKKIGELRRFLGLAGPDPAGDTMPRFYVERARAWRRSPDPAVGDLARRLNETGSAAPRVQGASDQD